MKTSEIVVKSTIFRSEIRPEIETDSAELAKTLEWADEIGPRVFDLVSGAASKAYGKHSSMWYGYERGENTPSKVLSRLQRFRERLGGAESTWTWSARFSLENVYNRGFTGGLFQEHCLWTDGKVYARGCLVLDYTPSTLDEVRTRFEAWCEAAANRYDGRQRITLDGVEIWSRPGFSSGDGKLAAPSKSSTKGEDGGPPP